MSRLLVVDDEKPIRDAIRLALQGDSFVVEEAANLDAAYRCISSKDPPDLVLLDVHFPGGATCHGLLERLAAEAISIPIVVLSGAASAKEAADAIRAGAYDFIEKPITSERLRVSLANALASFALKASLRTITTERKDGGQVLGASEALQTVKRLVGQYAAKDVKVLITGETGTGKEVVAHSLWENSLRKDKPFIIVNVAAIPETLIESELFGHKKGAFTGATSNQLGKIEMADGGTLFLDEIGELPVKSQGKLLRFLESGEVQTLGSTSAKRCDVRLIAATSRNLADEIIAGRFREDLFFRLNVARIELPPLRERGADTVTLFRHFVGEFSKRHQEKPRTIQKDVDAALMAHSWQGNIRELRNVAERAVLLSKDAITKELIEGILGPALTRSKSNTEGLPAHLDDVQSLKDYRARAEARYIGHVLWLAEGSVTKAAQALRVDRSHLHQKIKHYGLE